RTKGTDCKSVGVSHRGFESHRGLFNTGVLPLLLAPRLKRSCDQAADTSHPRSRPAHPLCRPRAIPPRAGFSPGTARLQEILAISSLLPREPQRRSQLGYLYVPPFRIQGISVAGAESVVQVPELDTCFDIGKCPRAALASNYVA